MRGPRSADSTRLGLAVSAVVLRLVAVATLGRTPSGVHDPMMYQAFATHIANGRGYASWYGHPTSYYPPGYPWFLGIHQRILNAVGLGDSLVLAAGISQAFIGGVATWALVGVGMRLDSDPRRGRILGLAAGAIFAFWPNLILHSSVLLSESLFLGCLSVSLLGFAMLIRSEAPLWSRAWWSHVAVTGIAFGLATLTRPQVLLTLPALAVGIALLKLPWRERLAILFAPAVLAGLVVIPWTIRNAVVFDQFVAVSTNGGDNLCIGFNPDARGHWFAPEYCETGDFYLDGPEAEARRNHDASALAKDWILANPSRIPALSVRKLFYTYEHDHDGLRAVEGYGSDEFLPNAVRSGLKFASNGFYVVVMVAAIGGVGVLGARSWAQRRNWLDNSSDDARNARGAASLGIGLLLSGLISAFLPVLFFGEARFKVPSTPYFALFAASTVAWMWTRRSARPTPEAPAES